jgi:hypothetical protein
VPFDFQRKRTRLSWIGDIGWGIVRAGWKPGPDAGHSGPAIISFTDFTFARWRDLPGAWLSGMRLRRAWPKLEGAVGLMLWVKPLSRRSGSISAWRSEADLRHFVSWPVHTAIMRKYASRMSGASTTWRIDSFLREQAVGEARRRLALDNSK